MEAKELMIGDKVMVKVLSQIPDTYVLHTWTANDYSRDIQVKPIPLTTKILEDLLQLCLRQPQLWQELQPLHVYSSRLSPTKISSSANGRVLIQSMN